MNAAAIDAVAGSDAVGAVRSTIKGPVMTVLRKLVPDLGTIPADAAYDHAIADIDLLDRCFRAFRQRRDAFGHLLVDCRGTVVADDSTTLSCGRTMEQVVAMIVRTAARRYFRSHMDNGRGRQAPERPKQGLLAGARALFAAGARPPAEAKPVRASAAEALYASIRSYLLFEWQVPLVPVYAKLAPAQVQTLGDRLLELKDADNLTTALKHAAAPPRALTASEQSKLLSQILTIDGKRLRGAAFAPVLEAADVIAALPEGQKGTQHSGVLACVGGAAATTLVEALALPRKHIAVLVLAAYDSLGSQAFMRVFGVGADAAVTARFMELARSAGIGPSCPLPRLTELVAATFTRPQAE